MSIASFPPVLLTDATWWGTLAAARELGRRGVPVVLASDVRTAPAAFSRYVRRVVRCPPTTDQEGFLRWLLSFGREDPGHILCATSDETAWCFARHHGELAAFFKLTPVEPQSLLELLDKARLMAAARSAGLDVPETWAPATEEEAVALASTHPGPLFLKPRLQLLANGGLKGERVQGVEAMVRAWRRHRRHAPGTGDDLLWATTPVLQRYVTAAERIFTVDGFSAGPNVAFPVLGCVKRVQRPRGSGPGLVFEHAPVPPSIARALARLLHSVGFRGPFDAEFIEDGDRRLLIDLNPRFYNHMSFESERGLPLGWLSYVLARGDEVGLRAAMAALTGPTGPAGKDRPSLYVHRQPLRAMRWLQGMLGRLSQEERQRWDRWIDSAGAVDPVRAEDDPGPARAALLLELGRALRHPRGWWRGLTGAPIPLGEHRSPERERTLDAEEGEALDVRLNR